MCLGIFVVVDYSTGLTTVNEEKSRISSEMLGKCSFFLSKHILFGKYSMTFGRMTNNFGIGLSIIFEFRPPLVSWSMEPRTTKRQHKYKIKWKNRCKLIRTEFFYLSMSHRFRGFILRNVVGLEAVSQCVMCFLYWSA